MLQTPLGRITLSQVVIEKARVGVFDHERQAPQPVEITLDVSAPLWAAAASDDVSQTIDYAALLDLVLRVALARHYALIESMAGAILTELMQRFPTANRAQVSICKPHALPHGKATVQLEVTR